MFIFSVDISTKFAKIYALPFSKFDLVSLLKADELPSHKRVIIWVGICCYETSSPVNLSIPHKNEF